MQEFYLDEEYETTQEYGFISPHSFSGTPLTHEKERVDYSNLEEWAKNSNHVKLWSPKKIIPLLPVPIIFAVSYMVLKNDLANADYDRTVFEGLENSSIFLGLSTLLMSLFFALPAYILPALISGWKNPFGRKVKNFFDLRIYGGRDENRIRVKHKILTYNNENSEETISSTSHSYLEYRAAQNMLASPEEMTKEILEKYYIFLQSNKFLHTSQLLHQAMNSLANHYTKYEAIFSEETSKLDKAFKEITETYETEYSKNGSKAKISPDQFSEDIYKLLKLSKGNERIYFYGDTLVVKQETYTVLKNTNIIKIMQ